MDGSGGSGASSRSATPSARAKKKKQPAKWDSDYPGKDPTLSGHLVDAFREGWGDSRSSPPVMSKENPALSSARSRSPEGVRAPHEAGAQAEAQQQLISSYRPPLSSPRADGRLSARARSTSPVAYSGPISAEIYNTGHKLSPRLRPKDGFVTDAYLAYVEHGERRDEARGAAAARTTPPTTPGGMAAGMGAELMVEVSDGLSSGPCSPDAPRQVADTGSDGGVRHDEDGEAAAAGVAAGVKVMSMGGEPSSSPADPSLPRSPVSPGAPGTKQREEYESTFLEYAEVLIGGVPMSQRSNKSNGVNVNALRATLGEPSPSELLKRQRSVSGAVDKIHYDGPAESELPPPPSVRGLGSPKASSRRGGKSVGSGGGGGRGGGSGSRSRRGEAASPTRQAASSAFGALESASTPPTAMIPSRSGVGSLSAPMSGGGAAGATAAARRRSEGSRGGGGGGGGKVRGEVASLQSVRPDQIGFRICIKEIRGHNVPDADGNGPIAPGASPPEDTDSDPYAKFSLLETDALTLESRVIQSGRTGVATGNVRDPVWGHSDDVTLLVPPGTPAALSLLDGTFPSLRVSIWDADEPDDDDLLGEGEIALDAPLGRHEYHALRGVDGFPDCFISFTYEVRPFMPSPPADIFVREMRIGRVEAIGEPFASLLRESASLGKPTSVHLRLSLVTPPDATPLAANGGEPPRNAKPSTPVEGTAVDSPSAYPSGTTASSMRWDDLFWPDLQLATMRMRLPAGGPRPPTVRVELWDLDLPTAEMPLAAGEVSLAGAPGATAPSGNRKLVLSAKSGLRDVAVAFSYYVKVLGPAVPAWAAQE